MASEELMLALNMKTIHFFEQMAFDLKTSDTQSNITENTTLNLIQIRIFHVTFN